MNLKAWITTATLALLAFTINTSIAQPGCIGFNADFEFTIDSINNNSTVYFTNTSIWTDSTTKYRWTYGDGSQSLNKEGSHTYTAYQNYNVCLYATNIKPNGDTTCHDSVCKFILVIMSLELTNKINTASIFPNPFTNSINIETGGFKDPTLITITDITGKTVAKETLPAGQQTISLNTASLPKGIYTIELQNAAQWVQRIKVVK